MWGMLAASIVLVGPLWVKLLLGLIGAAVTVHILCMARPGKRRADIQK